MIKHGVLGAAMAAMMIWMLHDRIMSGGISLSLGALAFVLAHVVVLMVGGALALLVPRVRRALAQHRPNHRHMAAMMAGAVAFAAVVHIILHDLV